MPICFGGPRASAINVFRGVIVGIKPGRFESSDMAAPISSQRAILSRSSCSSVGAGPWEEGLKVAVAKGIEVVVSCGEGGVIVIVGVEGCGRDGMMT